MGTAPASTDLLVRSRCRYSALKNSTSWTRPRPGNENPPAGARYRFNLERSPLQGFLGAGLKIRRNAAGTGTILVSLRERDRGEALRPGTVPDGRIQNCRNRRTGIFSKTTASPAPRLPLTGTVPPVRFPPLGRTPSSSTPERGRDKDRTGFRIRRAAVEHNCPCLTSLDTAGALATSLSRTAGTVPEPLNIASLFG